MGDRSGISWTDASWNPVVGCTKVSAGCKHCYAHTLHDQRHAAKMAGETEGAKNLPDQYDHPFTTVQRKPERLEMPLRWRRPRRIFVNSVSDLFHPDVPDEFIDQVFAVMALADRHVFQILTKRPERMASYFQRVETLYPSLWSLVGSVPQQLLDKHADKIAAACERGIPLPNVHLGVSAENQRAWDERVARLAMVPAAIRFVSAEPLIGAIDVHSLKHSNDPDLSIFEFGMIDWVIVGGESGPNYRPMDHDWARSIRDACVSEGVPFFFKQSAGPVNERGKLLDGERWEQMPEPAAAAASLERGS